MVMPGTYWCSVNQRVSECADSSELGCEEVRVVQDDTEDFVFSNEMDREAIQGLERNGGVFTPFFIMKKINHTGRSRE